MTFFDQYKYIQKYKNKPLTTVVSVIPNYPNTEISSEVLLNFLDGSQLLIFSDYDDIETPFSTTEDDSILKITATTNYETFCNIEGKEQSSMMVYEKIESIELIFDEVSLPNSNNPTCFYLIATFIKTRNKQFNIWKDLMTGFYLHGDYHFGDIKNIYSPENRWSDYDYPIHIKRIKYSVFDETLNILYDKIINS